MTADRAVAKSLSRPTTQARLPLKKAAEMCGWWLLLFSPLSAHTTMELKGKASHHLAGHKVSLRTDGMNSGYI